MKKTIIILIAVLVVGVGVYLLIKMYGAPPSMEITPLQNGPTSTDQTNEGKKPNEKQNKEQGESIIGKSVGGRNITAYSYGNGTKEILFVGGIHGGYSWNTALVAYELMDYLKTNPSTIPANVRVTVIPVLNPDGLNKVVGTAGRFAPSDVSESEDVRMAGRFNANNVDIKRHFDCDWKAVGTWQTRTVSGGSKAFSEPESLAIQKYIETHRPGAVVVWYSSVGGVFSSSCNGDILPGTRTITSIYAEASGYRAYDEFSYYEITGDMANWLAKNNIPAISVILTTHEDVEWDKNQAGMKALLQHYAK